jgi:hypothetical protein
MIAIATRNQGSIIEIKTIAPIMDARVLTNIRIESASSGHFKFHLGEINEPPSRLSMVSISKKIRRQSVRLTALLIINISPLEKRFMIRPRGCQNVNKYDSDDHC